jgi:hypothetical protein
MTIVTAKTGVESVAPGTRWKVTATYQVQTAPGVYVKCVRVRCTTVGKPLITLHFTEAEFDRIFC